MKRKKSLTKKVIDSTIDTAIKAVCLGAGVALCAALLTSPIWARRTND